MTHTPKFYNASGTLTDYALSCGYIERKDSHGATVTLWKEHGVYHVRRYDFATGKRDWDTFTILSNARRAFKGFVKTPNKSLYEVG